MELLTVLRDVCVEHGVKVERLKEAYRERAARLETTPLEIGIRLSPVGVDTVSRVRDALRRFLNLSDGKLFEIGAFIDFVGIRLPY